MVNLSDADLYAETLLKETLKDLNTPQPPDVPRNSFELPLNNLIPYTSPVTGYKIYQDLGALHDPYTYCPRNERKEIAYIECGDICTTVDFNLGKLCESKLLDLENEFNIHLQGETCLMVFAQFPPEDLSFNYKLPVADHLRGFYFLAMRHPDAVFREVMLNGVHEGIFKLI